MRRSFHSGFAARALSSVAAFGLLTTVVVGSARAERTPAAAPHRSTGTHSIEQVSGGLPIRFVENQGQFDSRVRFAASGHGGHIFLTDHDAVMVVGGGPADKDAKTSKPAAAVRMTAEGAASVAPVGVDVLPGRNNYFVGDDRSEWHTNVPAYAGVRYPKIYSGVDLVYYDAEGSVEYDFVVAPGADPSQIRLKFDGADSVSVEATGDLAIATAAGTIRQRRPTVYQETKSGARREIDGRYLTSGDGRVGFALGSYDRSAPLVIDPVLAYYDTIGGSANDGIAGLKVGPDGSAYIAGVTESLDFPETTGLYPSDFKNRAFVAKIDPTGTQLVYSTVFGGTYDAGATGLAIDASGSAYVSGFGFHREFPITPSPVDLGDDGLGFVTKFTPEGDDLVYSVFVNNSPSTGKIAVDTAGCAYVIGHSYNAATLPWVTRTVPLSDGSEGFVLKLDATATSVDYATLVGGSGLDFLADVAVDASGSVCVVGRTASRDLPTTPNAVQPQHAPDPAGIDDGFVARLDPTGSHFVFLTYLGGSSFDNLNGVAYGPSGDVYVCGWGSTGFPTTPGAYDTAQPADPQSGTKAVVARLSGDGTSLVYSTYFGGDVGCSLESLRVDGDGNAYFSGWTEAPDFPLTDQLFPGDSSGNFVGALDATGSNRLFAVQVSAAPSAGEIVRDAAGNLYTYGGTSAEQADGYVAKLVDLSASAVRVADATTGDVFVQETDPTSPNVGLWQYRSLSGNVYLGHATFTANDPGVRYASHDKQKGQVKMKADLDFRAGKASVDLRDLRGGSRRRLRTVLN